MSRGSLKTCLYSYLAYGWTGIVPASCADMLLFVPSNWAHWLWGWPTKFLARMASVNSTVFLIGPYSSGADRASGIDTREQVMVLPKGYTGGIMTDEIEQIAPPLKSKK